nr:wingless2 [Riptortus pedestris]
MDHYNEKMDTQIYNNFRERCQSMDFLVDKQKELCSLDEHIIEALRVGMKMAIEECQYQFSMIRWNCSTFTESPLVFGRISTIKSRETAYLYGISSAGVAYAITRACTKGVLTECNCDSRVMQRKPRKQWKWGGCSEDIHYGEKFSREFIDCNEDPSTPEGLMNLHNNEAGRRVIRSRMQKVCKCHGMSGSCSVRVCWRKLPPFRLIGDVLNSRFEGASSVRLVEKKRRKNKDGERKKKLRVSKKDIKPPNKTELVYLEDSPDYCEKNETLGVLGTHGRLCRRESPGLDGCKLLCCGRGYQTRLREVQEKCKCNFVWCCNVICEICSFTREEHICN